MDDSCNLQQHPIVLVSHSSICGTLAKDAEVSLPRAAPALDGSDCLARMDHLAVALATDLFNSMDVASRTAVSYSRLARLPADLV